jgi:hypothetical protein
MLEVKKSQALTLACDPARHVFENIFVWLSFEIAEV